MSTIAVIGAGSWGTALSLTLCRLGHAVRLWAYEEEVVESIRRKRENSLFLPGISLPEGITPTTSLFEALEGARFVLTVMPSHVCRTLYEEMLPCLYPEMIFVSATKGLDVDRLMRMSEVIREVVSQRFAPRLVALSGPSFAQEVARGDPTAVVAASEDAEAAREVQKEFSSGTLRLYTTGDVAGVELGAAVKNVIAIAAGVVDGLGLGHNAQAALITRGLAEISRLAAVLGGRRETLAGLTGLGDLVLTCTGALSRNRQLGIDLAGGRSLAEIQAETKTVAEGVFTTGAALALGNRHGVELPIAAQMAEVLAGRKSPRAAVEDLMLRPQRVESDPR